MCLMCDMSALCARVCVEAVCLAIAIALGSNTCAADRVRPVRQCVRAFAFANCLPIYANTHTHMLSGEYVRDKHTRTLTNTHHTQALPLPASPRLRAPSHMSSSTSSRSLCAKIPNILLADHKLVCDTGCVPKIFKCARGGRVVGGIHPSRET